MSNRISKDMYYLSIAKQVSERSTCLRRKYGAIIVNHDEIISSGYNGAPRGEENCSDRGWCTRELLNIPKGERYEICVACHAECNAIISAERSRMIGGTIYIAGTNTKDGSDANPAPCAMCRRMIVNAGITECIGLIGGESYEISLTPPKIEYPFDKKNNDDEDLWGTSRFKTYR